MGVTRQWKEARNTTSLVYRPAGDASMPVNAIVVGIDLEFIPLAAESA